MERYYLDFGFLGDPLAWATDTRPEIFRPVALLAQFIEELFQKESVLQINSAKNDFQHFETY